MAGGPFNPRMQQPRLSQNARELEEHVSTAVPYPHFGEQRPPRDVYRRDARGRLAPMHSHTSIPYSEAMSYVTHISTPQHQYGRAPDAYSAIASLDRPIDVTVTTNPRTVQHGTTRYVGLYGRGTPQGFDRIATAYPCAPDFVPSVTQLPSSVKTSGYDPRFKRYRGWGD